MCGANPCGKTDCTWSAKFRFESEARQVSKMPGEWRASFYALAEKQRGPEAVARLKAEVKRQYAARSPSPAGSGSATQPPLF
jgi:hypothetical protein